MFYPDNVVEEVRLGNDIIDVIGEYVRLVQKGSSHFGLCPFHSESTPSFSVSADKQLYYCFGCGASGNVYSFIMEKENFDFPDAVKHLADRIHYTLPEEGNTEEIKRTSFLKKSLYELHKVAARYFYTCLQGEHGAEAVKYLDTRQVESRVRKKFGLGYAPDGWNSLTAHLMAQGFDNDVLIKSGLVLPDKKGGYHDRFRNRLMFPILDVHGRVTGFGGRILQSGEPKYLNSPETPIFEKRRNLYGLNFARQSGARELILVEGYMDVISLYQAGFTNAVAALGTAFSQEHARVLKKYADMVYILFDSDEAGEKAALRAIPFITAAGIKSKVIRLHNAKDPDDFIKAFGAQAFKKEINKGESHMAFQIKNLSGKYDLSDSQEKIDFTKEVSKLLSKLTSPVELDVYTKEAARITGISESAIESEINRTRGGAMDKSQAKNKSFTPGGKLGEKGLADARKSIIYLTAMNPLVYPGIRALLKPEELVENCYISLLEMVYREKERGGKIVPADFVSRFEKPEEQRLVSDIFINVLEYDDVHLLNKALNDQLKIVKKAYIDEKMAEITDMRALQDMYENKQNIENLNITLKEG